MSPHQNRMAGRLRPSATMAAAARPPTHSDPVNLATGELEGPPPAVAVDAANAATRKGGTRYGPAGGLVALRTPKATE